jgi:hypothetical protein
MGQRFLCEDAGQQQRLGVCRGKEDGVDRKQCVDGPHYFGLKSCATQSRGTAAHQIIRTPRNGAARFHTAIFLSPHPMKHPTLEGWWRGHLQISMAA